MIDRTKLIYWNGICVGVRNDDGSITWYGNAPQEVKDAYSGSGN